MELHKKIEPFLFKHIELLKAGKKTNKCSLSLFLDNRQPPHSFFNLQFDIRRISYIRVHPLLSAVLSVFCGFVVFFELDKT